MALVYSGTAAVLALGAVVLAVYMATLSPTIAGGDSGELVAEGCILGTAHPPGYPLFTLLGYAISRYTYIKGLSEGSPAERVNASSALYTALASVFMGLSVQIIAAFMSKDRGTSSNYHLSSHSSSSSSSSMSRRILWLKSLPGVIFTMFMFAFSPLIWQYAVTAEVFPLNTLFASLLLYLVLEFAANHKKTVVLLGSFVSGLALCNQHTIVLFEAPLIMWMLVLLRSQLIAKRDIVFALQIGASFLAGLVPYLYLPLTGNLNPTMGSWGELSTAEGLLHHVLRRDYGTFQLFSGNRADKHNEDFYERNAAYARDLYGSQGLYVTPYLAALGAASALLLLRKHRTGEAAEQQQARPKGAVGHAPRAKQRGGAIRGGTPHRSTDSSTAVAAAETTDVVGVCAVYDYECQLTPLAIVLTFIFYFAVFHQLSNMPLGEKLLFGVHQRFWMQPNTIAFILAGVGLNVAGGAVAGAVEYVAASLLGPARPASRGSGSGTAPRLANTAIFAACTAISLAVCYAQLRKYYWISDQSDSYHFLRYARAIMDPLPLNSVLIINYDMQWTAIRYLQQCEGYRPDVTSINLSMMTYRWFRHKHDRYPSLIFPGTFHAARGSKWIASDGAFTFKAFIDANINSHPIFIGGKLNYADPELEQTYDLVPSGLVRRFTPRGRAVNATVFLKRNAQRWQKVRRALPVLPDAAKYPEETWEWTIGRDFKDAVADTAGYYLDLAIQIAANDSLPLVDAVYWLESAIALEEASQPDFTKLMYILYKNSGLGHVHLVQNKRLGGHLPTPPADHFGTLESIGWPHTGAAAQGNWKKWSTDRFTYTWGRFLSHPQGALDSQYEVIRDMYRQATGSTPQQQGAREQQQQQQQQQQQKKKMKKKSGS